MKKIVLITKLAVFILLLLLFVSCINRNSSINLLTDDILLFEIVDKYNFENPENKINISYYNNKNDKIFSNIKINDFKNVDIIAGYYSSDIIIDSANFRKIPVDFVKNKSQEGYFSNFYKNTFGYCLPYNTDFFVVVTKKDLFADITDDRITFDNLLSFSEKNKSKGKIIFSPKISAISEIDFLFTLNSHISYENKEYSFNNAPTKKAYSLYNNFDELYNFGKDNINQILKANINIDKSFYLKKDVILFDFQPLSRALTLDKDNYSIYFIEGLKYSSLKKKIIAITKNNFNKKSALRFIDYLTAKEAQSILFNSSLKKSYFYNHINIPIDGNYIDLSNDLISPQYSKNIIETISGIEEINFYNNRIKEKFFSSYSYSKDLLIKEQIKNDDFLHFFSKEINK